MELIMKEIFFSVLIPVYNVEKYLKKCLESVINQTYSNFEVIVVDDGSTDSSGQICDEFAIKYSQFKVFHKQNTGQLHTRQYSISKASGDYYVFLDSDDSLSENALKTIYNTILKYDCDCVIYGLKRVLPGNEVNAEDSNPILSNVITDKRELYSRVLNDPSYNSLCRKACKSTLFENIDYSEFYHIKHGEDLIQSINILKNSQKTVIIDNILYNYTFNPDSITHSVTYENYKVDFTVEEMVLEFLKEQSVFSEEDFNDFRGKNIKILYELLIKICQFDTTLKNKIGLLKEIRRTEFYNAFIASGSYCVEKKIALFWRLFKWRLDFILVPFIMCYLRLRK